MPVVDASLLDGGAAGAADAFAAAVGQLVAGIEARLQDGLSVGNFETVAARLERDAVGHGEGANYTTGASCTAPPNRLYCPYTNSLALVQCASANAAVSSRSTPASGSSKSW